MKKIYIIGLLSAVCAGSAISIAMKDSGSQKVFSRNALEREAGRLVELGEYDAAVEKYREAAMPKHIRREYQKASPVGRLVHLLRIQGKFEEALKEQEWFLRDGRPTALALEQKKQLECLVEFKKSGNSKVIKNFIQELKTDNASHLPPQNYSQMAPAHISDILQLYDIIGDHDAGIKFIDSILEWGYQQDADITKIDRVATSSEAEKLMNRRTADGMYYPNWREYKWVREYLLVREAFERDKAEGSKGRATKAIIQSDYFPW